MTPAKGNTGAFPTSSQQLASVRLPFKAREQSDVISGLHFVIMFFYIAVPYPVQQGESITRAVEGDESATRQAGRAPGVVFLCGSW